MEDRVDDERGTPYALRLGERLRNVRRQQGLSLHDVEASSEGRMKASVVGAYERGERAVSVARLRTLADFYRVPITRLLPEPETPAVRVGRGHGLRIDLTRLTPDDGDLVVIDRYLRSIQARRGDYNGRVLTMRGADLQMLAAVLDTGPDDLRDRLVDAGIASLATA